jgi:hypothetical protein
MKHILKSTPEQLAKFPPPVYLNKHKVSTGDNWWNLATKYGRSDPWDIIEYNFRTRDPSEVNFYLEFYVGCTEPSPDGKNYRFDSADNPGHIYIPPFSWTPSEDLALRQMVAFALTGGLLSRLSVRHKGQSITGTSLAAIGVKVLRGDIHVVVDPSKGANEAEYDSGSDTFLLGFRRATTTTKKALLAHEAVHAALDNRSAPGMKIKHSEALGHVVQCYYVRGQMRDPDSGKRISSTDPGRDKVWELAWDMAGTLLNNKQPTPIEWLALDNRFTGHPDYKDIADDEAFFDGI